MARKRARKTYCPDCDGQLDPALARDSAPRCPHCDAALQPVRVSGFVRRSLAGTIDFSVLLLTAGLLNAGLLALIDAEPLLGGAKGLAILFAILDLELGQVLQHIAPFLVMSVFYLTLFWTITGRTPGGRVLGLRVVGSNGLPPQAPWALLRALAHLAGVGIGFLGWLWTALDAEKRGWHDHLGRTYVVRDP
ncbi:MAG: RDD family protein [Nannocystaceae bacterium]|nr:RDD family protein [Nannocystaceae bacterium]